MREWSSRNRDKVNARNKAYKQADPDRYHCSHLRSIFGISLAEYREIEAAQEGKCAACRQPETAMYRTGGVERLKRLAVDHDHETGRVRGLLCATCNTALGLLQEDPQRARMLADYMEFSNDIPLRWAPNEKERPQ